MRPLTIQPDTTCTWAKVWSVVAASSHDGVSQVVAAKRHPPGAIPPHKWPSPAGDGLRCRNQQRWPAGARSPCFRWRRGTPQPGAGSLQNSRVSGSRSSSQGVARQSVWPAARTSAMACCAGFKFLDEPRIEAEMVGGAAAARFPRMDLSPVGVAKWNG